MSQRELNDYDLKRYDRQMMIRGFGEEGQKKLKNTKVFVAGCGGLGSPIAYVFGGRGLRLYCPRGHGRRRPEQPEPADPALG